MFSGGQDGYSFIPRWNEEAVTLEPFDQRVKLFASSTKKEETYLCGPEFSPRSTQRETHFDTFETT